MIVQLVKIVAIYWKQAFFCLGAGKCVLDKEAEMIPDWCPLMDLPEKDNGDYPANTSDAGFVEGWNQCIDEITGGNSDD